MSRHNPASAPGLVGAVIPVRTQASRLPRKPLLDVAGHTALERVVSQAARCRYVRKIVVATTSEPADDELAALAERLGLGLFRGASQDVLRRIADAGASAGMEAVVEVDGDDLLCSHEYMDRGLELLYAEGADMVRFEALPVGGTPTILRAAALQQAVSQKPSENTETGFFQFIEESPLFRVVRPHADLAHQHQQARMTLDYPEDLEFFRAVWQRLDALGPWHWEDLLDLLRREPQLVEMNRDRQQAYSAHFQAELSKAKRDLP